MSHSISAPLATVDAKSSSAVAVGWTLPAPVLITEHQIALSTAAAAPLAEARRRWLDANLITGLARALNALTQPQPHCPRHEHSYFEVARMSREMGRL